MCVRACVCVCVFACMCVCVCACVCANVRVSACVCEGVCDHACMHQCVSVFGCVSTQCINAWLGQHTLSVFGCDPAYRVELHQRDFAAERLAGRTIPVISPVSPHLPIPLLPPPPTTPTNHQACLSAQHSDLFPQAVKSERSRLCQRSKYADQTSPPHNQRLLPNSVGRTKRLHGLPSRPSHRPKPCRRHAAREKPPRNPPFFHGT